MFKQDHGVPTCNASSQMKRRRDEIEGTEQYPAIPRIFNLQQSRVLGRSASQLKQQGLEIDALICLQGERMRSELEVMMKRQRGEVISLMGQQIVKMLKDKDADIERASRRNIELEQKVRELAAESMLWFTAAKNNEVLASSLKSTLEQILLQSTASAAEYGGCDAEDAASCCYEGVDEREELRRRTACEGCGVKEVCALILPCRHLCLCNDCEPMFDTCPVCHSTKSGCLQILF